MESKEMIEGMIKDLKDFYLKIYKSDLTDSRLKRDERSKVNQ